MQRARLTVGVGLALVVLLTACSGSTSKGGSGASRPLPSIQPSTSVHQSTPKSPNIVFVLMDDFSMDLLPTMRTMARMASQGASYSNSFVVDSLCCVSRAATFTGQYPHQTGVLTNTSNLPNRIGPIGGYPSYQAHGNNLRAFAVHLQQAGYTTGFIGKYLNQYDPESSGGIPPPPPGWSDPQTIFEGAYDEWGFQGSYVAADGRVHLRDYPVPPASASDQVKDKAYAGNVIARSALGFIHSHERDRLPYFLEVAPYAPHNRVGSEGAYPGDPIFPAAFRDRPGHRKPHGNCGALACPQLGLRDLPGYGDNTTDNTPRYADGRLAPSWNPLPAGLPPKIAERDLRNRARMAQSVDRMLAKILRSVGPNTYVIATSDNGFHLGQHGLTRGKGTAYDSDVHVPLVVVGPGVKPGPRDEVVTNIDLAPTFEDLAGVGSPSYRSGVSLVPSLRDPNGQHQNFAFIEHTWSKSPAMDPDRPFAGGGIDVIPSYVAVRSRTGLLVRDDLDRNWDSTNYAYEYYHYATRRWEKVNQFGRSKYAGEVSVLMHKLHEFDVCSAATGNDPVSTMCRHITE